MSETASPETWVGPFRTPRNMAAEARGSIHDDATATRLGFRGGTVAGSIHLDQFVPRLVETFGPRWFETGGLSVYFTQATVDREEVQCAVEPGADRLRLSMHNRDGALICQGTASAQPDARSELARRFDTQTPAAAGALRILAEMQVGDENHDLAVAVAPESCMYVTDSVENAEGFMKGRIVRGLKLAPVCAERLRECEATEHWLRFPAMDLRVSWCRSKAPYKQDGWPLIFGDEVSTWPAFAPDQLRKRADMYAFHHIVFASSPDPTRRGNPEHDPIIMLFADTDKRQWFMPDPGKKGKRFHYRFGGQDEPDGIKWPTECRRGDEWDLDAVRHGSNGFHDGLLEHFEAGTLLGLFPRLGVLRSEIVERRDGVIELRAEQQVVSEVA
jgi:hypothetical protein